MTETHSSCSHEGHHHHHHDWACEQEKEYKEKCETYTEKVEKYCDPGEQTSGGTLIDGVILDLVQGIATERDISEIF